ncbi:hypothetical protein C8024_17575 [Sphingopyxis sp. BSNA05]|uniref:hypothetical protein n=1 Tax=Sphingomonadales TaxID=204457 RepID=UPI000C1F5625|nr:MULTISPECIES: hypothetical protein [Sphingomonadaceae]ATW04202.1 hypothetical protein CHN51_12175 [Sphingorhabdus sp. YGSMI21]NRD90868.1 hypothetical protein [Sphingopyxis sp. BSNA05]
MPPLWMMICGLSGTVALISEIGNRRRSNRRDIEDVGFMPWSTITALALLTFGISIAFGLGILSTE